MSIAAISTAANSVNTSGLSGMASNKSGSPSSISQIVTSSSTQMSSLVGNVGSNNGSGAVGCGGSVVNLTHHSPPHNISGSPPNGHLADSRSNNRPMLNSSPLTNAALPSSSIHSDPKDLSSTGEHQRSPIIGSAATSGSTPISVLNAGVEFFVSDVTGSVSGQQSLVDSVILQPQSHNFTQWTSKLMRKMVFC